MQELGLNAYRFSISWSRVLPEGTGRVNEKGLDFYRRLVDALGEAGIEPNATLFHWDLPAALDDRGGWLNRDIAGWFADYARVVFRALDDRVRMWATLNEPWVVTDGGYLHGVLAPGPPQPLRGADRRAQPAARARRRGRRLPRRGKARASASSSTSSPSTRPRTLAEDLAADAAGRRVHEPPVPRPAAARPLSRGARRDLRRGVAGVSRGGPRRDPAADRLPRRQLLHAQRRAGTSPRRGPSAPGRVQQPGLHTEMDWEVYPDGLARDPAVGARAVRQVPALRHRERRGASRTRSRSATVVEDPLRVAYLRDHLLAVAPRDRRRRRRARLLRLVAARQLRVVAGVLEAVRDRPRGLRDAEADGQGERAVLRARSSGRTGRRWRRTAQRDTPARPSPALSGTNGPCASGRRGGPQPPSDGQRAALATGAGSTRTSRAPGAVRPPASAPG